MTVICFACYRRLILWFFYDVKDREHPFLILNVLILLLFSSTVQMLEIWILLLIQTHIVTSKWNVLCMALAICNVLLRSYSFCGIVFNLGVFWNVDILATLQGRAAFLYKPMPTWLRHGEIRVQHCHSASAGMKHMLLFGKRKHHFSFFPQLRELVMLWKEWSQNGATIPNGAVTLYSRAQKSHNVLWTCL